MYKEEIEFLSMNNAVLHSQIKNLTAERDDLKAALERCENWFESQAKVVSKGCGSPFDLMMLRDERGACSEALKGMK